MLKRNRFATKTPTSPSGKTCIFGTQIPDSESLQKTYRRNAVFVSTIAAGNAKLHR
jgi:hypothetical protein